MPGSDFKVQKPSQQDQGDILNNYEIRHQRIVNQYFSFTSFFWTRMSKNNYYKSQDMIGAQKTQRQRDSKIFTKFAIKQS